MCVINTHDEAENPMKFGYIGSDFSIHSHTQRSAQTPQETLNPRLSEMAWYRTALWIWLVAAVYEICCSSPSSFSNSLSLTRAVRSRVQKLLLRYKEEKFGDAHFDDKRIVLNTLPTVTIAYQTWLQMEDTERLYRASHDLQSFWTHLENQRQKLQGNSDQVGVQEMKMRNRQGKPGLPLSQSILGIQLDIRDLMKQVTSQLHSIRMLKKKDDSTHTPPPTSTFSRLINPTPTTSSNSRPNTPSSSTSTVSTRSALDLILSSTVPSANQPKQGEPSLGKVQQNTPKPVSSQWVSILEGYVILRDLEHYLSRLARDYTLLRAKS